MFWIGRQRHRGIGADGMVGKGIALEVQAVGWDARRAAGHLFGPLLIQSRNPRFLYGSFPLGDMGNVLFHKFFVQYWGYF